jgi:PKD repeat protein
VNSGGSVQFTDTSTNMPTSWQWNFSDGTANSTGQNPLHAFPVITDGVNHYYTIMLTATNDGGSGTRVIPELITVNAIAPLADFTASPTIVVNGNSVQFTDTSTNGPNGWQWNFGDGTANATTRNPVHTFPVIWDGINHTYNVTLTAGNIAGSSTVRHVEYITVIPRLVASFMANVTSGTVPLCIQFNDSSLGYPQTWQWNFDDGATNVTTQNATHTYAAAGTYAAMLTVTNGSQTNTYSCPIVVSAIPENPPAGTSTPLPSWAVTPTPTPTSTPTPTPVPTDDPTHVPTATPTQLPTTPASSTPVGLDWLPLSLAAFGIALLAARKRTG